MRLLPGALALLPSLVLAAPNPESFPAPVADRWVIDLTGRIPVSDVAAANELAMSANERKLGQVAVLIIDSTSGRNPRSYAEDVHHQWHLGTGRGDGVLFFVALNDRAAETLLPYGLRSDEDQWASDNAMQQVIVPAFKRGALGEAIREGTRALVKLLENSRLNMPDQMEAHLPPQPERTWRSPSELPDPAARGFSVDAANALTANGQKQLETVLNGLYADGHGKLYVYVVRGTDFREGPPEVAQLLYDRLHPARTPGVQVAVIAVDTGYVAIAGQSTRPAAEGWALNQLRQQTRLSFSGVDRVDDVIIRFATGYDSLVTYGPRIGNYTEHAATLASEKVMDNSGAFGFGGLAFLGGGAFGLAKWLRHRKRRCKVCGDYRLRLDEQSDDSYLSAGQTHEENLRSVDYDVWWCARCEDALVLRYRAWFTAYQSCPNCSFVCAMQTTKTLVHATYSSGGQVQVDLKCNRCNYHQSHVRYTPRLQRSTSSSGSSRSSFGSSSSSRSSFGGSSGRW